MWDMFRLGKLRTNVWNVMEYPETSKTAQVYDLHEFITCFTAHVNIPQLRYMFQSSKGIQ
jgi:hypothetical protein